MSAYDRQKKFTEFCLDNSICNIRFAYNEYTSLPFILKNKYHKSFLEKVFFLLDCSETVFIIIQKMNTGFFMSKYSAEKLPFFCSYINDTHFKKKDSYNLNNKCSIIIIDSEWDISKWDFTKLEDLNEWINYIPEKIDTYKYSIDFEFCKAMGLMIE